MNDNTPGDPLGIRKRGLPRQPSPAKEPALSARAGLIGLTLGICVFVAIFLWPKPSQIASAPRQEVTSDYFQYLNSLRDNPESRRAAEFLLKSGLKIFIAPLTIYERGEAGAHYDNDLDQIVIAPDIGSSIGVRTGDPSFVPLTAGIVVHEIQHAIDFRAIGLLASETEVLATSRGALFELHRARRGKTPAAESIARKIGITCTPWFSCLPPQEIINMTAEAYKDGRVREGIDASQFTQIWIGVAGWDVLLQWVQSRNGSDTSMFSVQGNDAEMVRTVSEELAKSPEAMEKLLERDGVTVADRAKLLEHGKANLRAWGDPARVAAARKYFAREFAFAKKRFSER